MRLIEIDEEEFDSLYIAEKLNNSITIDGEDYKYLDINHCSYMKIINMNNDAILMVSVLLTMSKGVLYICSNQENIDKLYRRLDIQK